MSGLWRGPLVTKLRIASGLVLFAFALTHFLNIGLGILSDPAMQIFERWREMVTRSLPGTVLLYGAFMVHGGLAIFTLARRRTLRMPWREVIQILLGLSIPLLLAGHLAFTRVAHELYGLDDRMPYLIGLIFGTRDGWLQSLLLLIVWTHACIGLTMWLGRQAWWRPALPYLAVAAALVPTLALIGFLTEGRRVAAEIAAAPSRRGFFEGFGYPGFESVEMLGMIQTSGRDAFLSLLGLALAIFVLRRLLLRRRFIRIRYVDGPQIKGLRGMTLLEMSRANGVPHAAQCGGRGRCTTCRVQIVEGADSLPPASDAEKRSLRAVGAPPGTRLACQLRPTAPLFVYRVFHPDGLIQRSPTGFGQEARLAILFLDIRGFTARTTGHLPYDVVFLLNRFFDAIVPAIRRAGGQVDKYLGDGLLALFEAPTAEASARHALAATTEIGRALEAFNQRLADEGGAALRIGLGVHLGDLVLGEIGAAGDAPRTIIGETVNAASRLEAMTKELGVEALVSEAVLTAAGVTTDGLPLQELQLRGVREPVRALPLASAAEAGALHAQPQPA